jgi:hypothetical protein
MLPPRTIAAMSVTADAVVSDVLFRGSREMQAPPRTEVGFVAALALGGIRNISAAWRPLLARAGWQLTVTGVFCHAAPLVRFKSPKGPTLNCELADMLVVMDQEQPRNHIRIANLIQAKMAAKAMRVQFTGASSQRQLDLYQQWPPFSFIDRVYGPGFYNLRHRAAGDAGSFGVIDRHFRNETATPPRWTQHRASPTPHKIIHEPMLGTYLANMAASKRGYGRRARPNGSDDWSKVVDLLLRVTYQKTFKHVQTLGRATSDRGNTAQAYFLVTPRVHSSQQHVDRGWWPPFEGFDVVEDDSPGGISVLHMTLAKQQD